MTAAEAAVCGIPLQQPEQTQTVKNDAEEQNERESSDCIQLFLEPNHTLVLVSNSTILTT